MQAYLIDSLDNRNGDCNSRIGGYCQRIRVTPGSSYSQVPFGCGRKTWSRNSVESQNGGCADGRTNSETRCSRSHPEKGLLIYHFKAVSITDSYNPDTGGLDLVTFFRRPDP